MTPNKSKISYVHDTIVDPVTALPPTRLVHYELLNVEDDEDVELVFDVHKQWSQLRSIELYVTFEDGNPLYDPDPYQPEPYFDQAKTFEPEPSQLEPYIPLGDMADFDQQEISEESEEETYFDEDEEKNNEGDNDNGDDLEPTYDPPFHMRNLNLDYAYQSSEFDMPSNEPPPLDASLEIGMKDSLSQKSKQWVIGRLKRPHNCANSSMSQDHTKLDSNIICESIKSLLKVDPSIKVKVIIAHIRERYNYTITYRKAWMAKKKAIETIYGNWEKSYNDIPRWLLAMQKFLPRTIVEMKWMKLGCTERYALNEPSFKYYHNEIKMANPKALRWIGNIPPEQWTMAYSQGQRWGHMTTNVSESINAVLKGTRNLPITALI
uniref:Uncharacterized protein LOC101492937 n=1 Tax=Cicer arietinum TaxID=3827 RepID=A0A1S2XKJ2_CICAR|nr:uncharacterized protein LOC101492937 [Cicer arietinum]